jgi:hypothetical protein
MRLASPKRGWQFHQVAQCSCCGRCLLCLHVALPADPTDLPSTWGCFSQASLVY